MKRLAMSFLATVALLAGSSNAASAQGGPPPQCPGCAFVEVFGIPVYAFCDPSAQGSSFQDCFTDHATCWGPSCGWAESTILPELRRLAKLGDHVRFEAIVKTYPEVVRRRGPSDVEVLNCRGTILAVISLTKPSYVASISP